MTSRGAVTAAPAIPGAARLIAADTPASRIAVRERRVGRYRLSGDPPRRAERFERSRDGVTPDAVVVCRTSALLLGCGVEPRLVRVASGSSGGPDDAGCVGVGRDSGRRCVRSETGHWSRMAI